MTTVGLGQQDPTKEILSDGALTLPEGHQRAKNFTVKAYMDPCLRGLRLNKDGTATRACQIMRDGDILCILCKMRSGNMFVFGVSLPSF